MPFHVINAISYFIRLVISESGAFPPRAMLVADRLGAQCLKCLYVLPVLEKLLDSYHPGGCSVEGQLSLCLSLPKRHLATIR